MFLVLPHEPVSVGTAPSKVCLHAQVAALVRAFRTLPASPAVLAPQTRIDDAVPHAGMTVGALKRGLPQLNFVVGIFLLDLVGLLDPALFDLEKGERKDN